MRTVVNYDTLFPSKRWVISASLLWDRIGLACFLEGTESRKMIGENDGIAFLSKMSEPDLDDLISFPFGRLYAADRVSEDGQSIVHHDFEEVGVGANFMIQLRPESLELVPRPGVITTRYSVDGLEGSYREAAPRLSTWSLTKLRRECEELQSNEPIDIISANSSVCFETQTEKPLVHLFDSLDALVPSNPMSIEPTQLIDFRKQNELRRIGFRRTLEQLMTSFKDASTEDDLKNAARLCVDSLRDEREKLRNIYRKTWIDATLHATKFSLAPSSLLAAALSMLHLSAFEPAAMVSAVSLFGVEFLRKREDGLDTAKASPYSYLIDLDKLG